MSEIKSNSNNDMLTKQPDMKSLPRLNKDRMLNAIGWNEWATYIKLKDLKSIPVANSASKDEIRKPLLNHWKPYEIPLKGYNEVWTVTMSESDTAVIQICL